MVKRRLTSHLKRVARWVAALVVGIGLAVSVNGTTASAINGAPQLTFPWGAPQNADGSNANAQFNYGPHDYFGTDSNQHLAPWNSLDLAPADHRVYAARGGNAYVECGGERIRIDHGDGYMTTYLHLYPPSVRIRNGYVTRSTWLARVILTSDNYRENCGTGTQNHVHFSLWYVKPGDTFNLTNARQAVDWGLACAGYTPTCPTAATPVTGQPQLGAWTIDDGIPVTWYGGCMTPLATPGVRYCGLYQNTTTYIFNDWLNEQIPTARRPGGQTEDLLMRGLSLHGFQDPTDSSGNPVPPWRDLGGLFKGSPTAVWNSTTTELDVFGVGIGDGIFYRRWFSTSGWDAGWTQIAAGTLVAGTALTESVNAERRQDGGVDLFFEGPAGDAQHASIDASLNYQWAESLGTPGPGGLGIGGAPSGRWNSQGTRLDVFVIGNDNHPYRKSFVCGYPYCTWGSWTGPYQGTAASAGSSSSGAAASVTEIVMAVRAPDDSIDLFFRGTANDGVHEWTDQYGSYIGMESLGCCIKGAPDAKWDATQTHLVVFAIGLNDQAYADTWSNPGWPVPPSWSGWTALGGGGVWG